MGFSKATVGAISLANQTLADTNMKVRGKSSSMAQNPSSMAQSNMNARAIAARHNERQFSMDDNQRRKLRLYFTRKTQERRLYMEELKEIRAENAKRVLKTITKSIGPTWYQVLSTRHRKALDELPHALFQDEIEMTARRSSEVLHVLGIYPIPHEIDVFDCIDKSRGNSMQFLTILFYLLYDHEISAKRYEYDLNGRILLSSIFYLGLPNLKHLLNEAFMPDREVPPSLPPAKKRKPPPHPCPYLRTSVVPLYFPERAERKPLPPPLPDLAFLNMKYEQEPGIPRPVPPSPPPPPPKKRLPKGYCQKLAGYKPFNDEFQDKDTTPEPVPDVRRTVTKRRRPSKMCLKKEKKVYGIAALMPPKKKNSKPKFPKSSIPNEVYNIVGVYMYCGRPFPIVGSLVRMPPSDIYMHGGFAAARAVKNKYIMVNLGVCAQAPPPAVDPCDCVERYEPSVKQFADESKCICKHYYDFKNDGSFQDEDNDQPYFEKPTSYGRMVFKYDDIFREESKNTEIEKEAAKIWEEDSVLNMQGAVDPIDAAAVAKAERNAKKRQAKVLRVPSPTCLGDAPKIEDYLRCCLQRMRLINIAARLPDVERTRELKEWMRRRLYGPLTAEQKKKMNVRSCTFFTYLDSLEKAGVFRPKTSIAKYDVTTYADRDKIKKSFEEHTHWTKVAIYKTATYTNNLLWAVMCVPEIPDKIYRNIFFSYVYGRVSDVMIQHPYNVVETMGRTTKLFRKRYRCIPKGAA